MAQRCQTAGDAATRS